MLKSKLYEFYQEYYDLDNLDFSVSNKRFLFLIYDSYHDYYLEGNHFIETDDVTSILKLIKVYEEKYMIDVKNFYPVCFSKQTLVIAINLNKEESCTLNKVGFDAVPIKYNKLIEYHMNKYWALYLSKRIRNEVVTSQKYIWRHKFYKSVIKRFLLTDRIKNSDKYKEILNDLLPKGRSIIDISCGDNSQIFDMAKNKGYEVVVGNDICLNYLNIQKEQDSVIYTNDRIEKNCISAKYDVGFCRNTLHHMNTINGINRLIDLLLRISKTAIIVEIEDPKKSNGIARILNKYLYTKFLKDIGNYYLDEKQFKSIINNKTKNYKVEYYEFKNILGNYMIAKISK